MDLASRVLRFIIRTHTMSVFLVVFFVGGEGNSGQHFVFITFHILYPHFNSVFTEKELSGSIHFRPSEGTDNFTSYRPLLSTKWH